MYAELAPKLFANGWRNLLPLGVYSDGKLARDRKACMLKGWSKRSIEPMTEEGLAACVARYPSAGIGWSQEVPARSKEHIVTKQEIVTALAARGIVLSPSQIRKSTVEKLQARLDKAGGPLLAVASSEAPAKDDAQPKKRRGTYAAPNGDYKPFRDGTRQAALFDLMARPDGATLEELAAAVPTWKPSTIKSAFHYDFASQHGVGVRSSFDEAGTERFHAIVPEAAA